MGYGVVRQGGRGEIRLGLLRFVAVCSGGQGVLRYVMLWCVLVRRGGRVRAR